MATKNPSKDGSNGRLPNGRFGRGNPGGPGNPFARQCAQLRSTLFSVVGKRQMKELCLALLERAKDGDMIAMRLALEYLLGKPGEQISPDDIERIERATAHERAAWASEDFAAMRRRADLEDLEDQRLLELAEESDGEE